MTLIAFNLSKIIRKIFQIYIFNISFNQHFIYHFDMKYHKYQIKNK